MQSPKSGSIWVKCPVLGCLQLKLIPITLQVEAMETPWIPGQELPVLQVTATPDYKNLYDHLRLKHQENTYG